MSSFSVQSQEEIYVSKQNGLFKMTSYSCPLTFVGYTFLGTTLVELYDIALTPNGALWGIYQNKIYSVNKQTGTLTLHYTLPSYVSSNSLLALDDSNLLFDAVYNGLYGLYKYNLNTNTVTLLGNVNYNSTGDLIFFDGLLYMSVTGYLIKINMNSNFTAVQSIEAVSTYEPYYPRFFGLATVSNPNYATNYVLGFAANHKLYKVCPIDGSYQLICTIPANSYNDFLGATATEVPIQNPIALTCPFLSSNDFLQQSQTVQLIPNPVNKDSQLQIKFPNNISSEIHIKIFSIDGKLLGNYSESLLNQSIVDINLTGIIIYSGIYMVELDAGDRKEFLKLIVN